MQAGLPQANAATDATLHRRRADLADLIRANPTADKHALTQLLQATHPGTTPYQVYRDLARVTSQMAFGLPPASRDALRDAASKKTTPETFRHNLSMHHFPERGRSFNASGFDEWKKLETAWGNKPAPTTDAEISTYLAGLDRTPKNAAIFAAMVLPPGWVGTLDEAHALWNDYDNHQLPAAATLMAPQTQQTQQAQPQQQPQAQQPAAATTAASSTIQPVQPQPPVMARTQPPQGSSLFIPPVSTPQVHVVPLAGPQRGAQTQPVQQPVQQPATSSMTIPLADSAHPLDAPGLDGSADRVSHAPLNTSAQPGPGSSDPFGLNYLDQRSDAATLNQPSQQRPQLSVVDLMDWDPSLAMSPLASVTQPGPSQPLQLPGNFGAIGSPLTLGEIYSPLSVAMSPPGSPVPSEYTALNTPPPFGSEIPSSNSGPFDLSVLNELGSAPPLQLNPPQNPNAVQQTATTNYVQFQQQQPGLVAQSGLVNLNSPQA